MLKVITNAHHLVPLMLKVECHYLRYNSYLNILKIGDLYFYLYSHSVFEIILNP